MLQAQRMNASTSWYCPLYLTVLTERRIILMLYTIRAMQILDRYRSWAKFVAIFWNHVVHLYDDERLLKEPCVETQSPLAFCLALPAAVHCHAPELSASRFLDRLSQRLPEQCWRALSSTVSSSSPVRRAVRAAPRAVKTLFQALSCTVLEIFVEIDKQMRFTGPSLRLYAT